MYAEIRKGWVKLVLTKPKYEVSLELLTVELSLVGRCTRKRETRLKVNLTTWELDHIVGEQLIEVHATFSKHIPNF